MVRPKQEFIGSSPAFLAVLEQTSRLALLNRSALVIGERGTGKELIAERLHFLSPRWDQAFIKMDCAALPESLLESELFGHEAGAFTGAMKLRRGRFEQADQGSLFLDELANMPATVQEKLLRVIEYGTFERVGGSRPVQVDVRVIAATNQDLPELAAQGLFRADLLDRLAFDVITLPPLRARREDILQLADHFAVKMSSELGRDLFPGFNHTVEQALLNYSWPGNIRELKNVVERAVYRMEAPDEPVNEIEFDPFDSPWRPGTTHTQTPATPATETPTSWPIDLQAEVQAHEILRIEQALIEARYHQNQAAKLLGLTYHQFRGLLRKYDITVKKASAGQ